MNIDTRIKFRHLLCFLEIARQRNVTARSNYRTDIDENRVILSYSLVLF